MNWPELRLSDWQDTYDTLHLWLQVVGKVRLRLTPHVNHWWETPLYVTARGLTTSPIPYRGEAFEVLVDFMEHRLAVETSWGPRRTPKLEPMAVANFHERFFAMLHELCVEARIWPVAVEFGSPVRLDEDYSHASYNPEYAHRCWRVLLACDALLKEFRGRFLGKESPVHFFWGGFDIAMTRFSGRRAPPRPDADAITREGYSHEVISAGWWPGTGDVDAAFYAYAAPEPPGFREQGARDGAVYDEKLKLLRLPYEEARRRPDPKAEVLDFFQNAYDVGATLGHWDRTALDRPRPWATA